jgi:ADP-ribose pyrophosphatase YjhB (NUDIX family)
MDVWNLPGGALESRELPTEAAIRETKEETGLEIEVERLIGVYGKAMKDELVFAFTGRVVGGRLTLTDEADACQFHAVNELPRNMSPKLVERVQDALAGGDAPVFRRQSQPETRQLVQHWQSEPDAG